MTTVRATKTRRGFTLVEMMVAVVIGGISVVLAAQIARTVIQQNAKSRQRTDFSSRSRLLGHQLRSDLRLAGVGATGAIAVDSSRAPFNSMSFTSAGGFDAIPAIAGANNLGAVAIGGVTIRDGSDAIQILVPNPGTLQRTEDRATSGSSVLTVPRGDAYSGCGMLYISDHSSPSGAGRAQVAFISGSSGTTVTISSALQFTVAPGADVMCARISTYWVDNKFVLHRSDITEGGNVVQPSGSYPLWINTDATNDVVAPGVLDLQIAYRMSAELYRLARANVPANDPRSQWVYEGESANPNAMVEGAGNYVSWFETRLVRINILARTLRKITESNDARDYPRLEDGSAGGSISVTWNYAAEWSTTTESATNLRYFDLGAPENVPADPF